MKYIYLIQIEETGVCKIGYTKNDPVKRLKSLQVGSPYKLILTSFFLSKWASKIERVLHKSYKSCKADENEYKLHGEFFKLDIKAINNFKETCEKIEKNFDVIYKNTTLKKPF